MRKMVFVTIAIMTLVGLSVAGAFLFRNKNNGSTSFRTVRIVKKNISSSVLATGSVEPMVGAEVKVGARISGKVEHLYSNIGDKVEKDQIIAEIEKSDLEANVLKKEAELKATEAMFSVIGNQSPRDIEKARAALGASKASLWPSLNAEVGYGYKDDIFPPKQEDTSAGLKVSFPLFSGTNIYNIKKAKSDLELTQMRYKDNSKIAEARVNQAKADLAFTKVQLSYATIRAPISGVIASVSTQEGETVAAGLNAPTFVTIIDLDRLQVDAFVDETDIGKVKVGQKAVFTVDTYPNKDFEGIVAAIYPKAIIQENVVNYDVVIEITSSIKNLLRPDMTASVTIYQEERKGVLMIPQKAVEREGGIKFVLVKMPDDTLQKKTIKTGIRSNNDIEIVSGLNEGDVVVIESK